MFVAGTQAPGVAVMADMAQSMAQLVAPVPAVCDKVILVGEPEKLVIIMI